MINSKQLRQIRLKVAQPHYAYDKQLAKTAKDYPEHNIYQTIYNPTTHMIYRYLSEFVMETLKLNTGKQPNQIKVLDWGGGKGYVTYFLNKRKFDITCFETEDFPHRAVWETFNLSSKTSSDPSVLPFESKTFDAIVGFGVLEHVPYDYESLKELNRVLKDDGLFFCFNLPNKYGYLHHLSHIKGINYHDRLYTSKETKKLLKRAGFNTIGRPWRRQLLPKNSLSYPHPNLIESIDLKLTNYSPLGFFATSIEFVGKKQLAYTSVH